MHLSYDRHGVGATLVLLHPLGADHHVWSPVSDRLVGQRDVIALDLPGFGDSPVLNTNGPPTPAALADAVATFLNGLGLADGYHVAGNSLGGWVALELAAAGRARSVTAIAAAGLWPEPLAPKRGIARTFARAADPLLPALMRSAAGRRLALGGTVADPSRVPPFDALHLVRTYATAPGFETVNAAMRAARFTGLERIRVPVTLAWAERDHLVTRPARVPADRAHRRAARRRSHADVGRPRSGGLTAAPRKRELSGARGPLLVGLERLADQPQHWRPQAYEQSTTLGISPFVLARRLGADPKPDTKADAAQRQGLKMPLTQSGVVK